LRDSSWCPAEPWRQLRSAIFVAYATPPRWPPSVWRTAGWRGRTAVSGRWSVVRADTPTAAATIWNDQLVRMRLSDDDGHVLGDRQRRVNHAACRMGWQPRPSGAVRPVALVVENHAERAHLFSCRGTRPSTPLPSDLLVRELGFADGRGSVLATYPDHRGCATRRTGEHWHIGTHIRTRPWPNEAAYGWPGSRRTARLDTSTTHPVARPGPPSNSTGPS